MSSSRTRTMGCLTAAAPFGARISGSRVIGTRPIYIRRRSMRVRPRYEDRPATASAGGESALGEREIGAVVLLVPVSQQIEQPRVRGHQHAGGAGLRPGVKEPAPVFPSLGPRNPGPDLEGAVGP